MRAPVLTVSLLNAGGNAVANGVSVGGAAFRATAISLPVGTYLAEVKGVGAAQNNYRLAIDVLP